VSPEVVAYLSAEIVLVAAALIIYMGGAFSKSQKVWAPIALASIVLAAASLWLCGGSGRYEKFLMARAVAEEGANIGGGVRDTLDPRPYKPDDATPRSIATPFDDSPVIADPLSTFGRWFALAVGAVMVLMAWRPLATGAMPEYLGSLLLIIAGLMLVSVASNLVLLFVGLELISIPTYILLTLGRRDPAAQEAAAKYFYLSILASAVLLYGLSFIYGAVGSMQLSAVAQKLASSSHLPDGVESFAKLGMVLVLAGLCFRVTAVPFHFYAPDVYQGTIQGNAALLSVLPKAAGLLAIVRLIVLGMPDLQVHAWKIVLALSVLTMTLGNVLALWQDNVRRLLAYSSIANAGYMLIGIAVGLAPHATAAPALAGVAVWNGVGATFFYLCVYAAATLGAFAVLAHLGRDRQQVESVDELAGLSRSHPAMASAMAVCMFSLAGLPPAAGLWGKLLVFGSALNVSGELSPWFVALAIIGLLNAAVAAYYYLRIVGLMYFREPLAASRPEGGPGAYLAALICAGAVVVFGFYPAPLMRDCVKAGSREHAGYPRSGSESTEIVELWKSAPGLAKHISHP
jgi:NADH-quinone oxidoreductase subunit N